MSKITFNEIPQTLETILSEMQSIKSILLKLTSDPKTGSSVNRWLNVTELIAYLPDHPKRATIYTWVKLNLIPCHKHQKKLRFLKSEVDAWLLQGKKQTIAELAEIDAEAIAERDSFLSNHKSKSKK